MDSSALGVVSCVPGTQELTDHRHAGPVVGVMLDDENNLGVATLARTLATGIDAPLRLLRPVVVPPQTPLELDERRLATEHELARKTLRTGQNDSIECETDRTVVVGHEIVHVIVDAAERWDARTVVFDVTPDTRIRTQLRGNIAEQVARRCDCTVLAANERSALTGIRSILVPVAGGPHSTDAVRVAVSLAEEYDAYVDLLHVVTAGEQSASEDSLNEHLERGIEAAGSFERVDTHLLDGDDPVATIIEQTGYYDLTVIGGPDRGQLRRFLFGSDMSDIELDADSPVITVWSGPKEV